MVLVAMNHESESQGNGVAVARPHACLDPMAILPSDLAALCFSFIDPLSLMCVVRRICHGWRDAVDSGTPSMVALWHDVEYGHSHMSRGQIAAVVKKSLGGLHTLKVQLQGAECLQHVVRSLSGLRVLHITFFLKTGASINPVLSCLRLLEDLQVCSELNSSSGVEFPPLPLLRSVKVDRCLSVSGIRNLPALTKLDLLDTDIADATEPWPTSIRELTIFTGWYTKRNPHVVDRIAALQQPVAIVTDWGFAHAHDGTLFLPPFDQLSFLAGFSTLQRFTVQSRHESPIPAPVIFKVLGQMVSLRELDLHYINPTDHDMQHLSQLSNLQQLKLYQIQSLTGQGLRHACAIPTLTTLCVSDCYGVEDYSCVGICSQLQDLQIYNCAHSMSTNALQAIAQLQHLETLRLFITFQDPHDFSHICTIRCLRHLEVICPTWCSKTDRPPPPFPAATFASLPSLSLLESFEMSDVGAKDEILDCLVQMPTLRAVRLRFGAEATTRLRDALPRLECLSLR